MRLSKTFPGGNIPFEGDRRLELRDLPAGVQILSATAVIAPAAPEDFVEEVTLSSSPPYPFGVTREPGIVDFHVRRTVRRIGTSEAEDSTVNVWMDMGGVWLPLNNDGTIHTQDGGEIAFEVGSGGFVDLRNVVTSRLQVYQADGTNSPVFITSVDWTVFPSNLTLGIEGQGPFWVLTGEMRAPAESADFAEALQAYLLDAPVESGYAIVPFILHSDTIARLDVTLEIEYLQQQSVLPEGVEQAVMPFTYEPLPASNAALITVRLPENAVVQPEGTRARVTGSFEPSRVVYGSKLPASLAQTVRIAPGISQGQPIQVEQDLAVQAVDLRIGPGREPARISLTFVGDAGGKPWGEALIQPVTCTLDPVSLPEPGWVSVPLAGEFELKARDPSGRPQRYWLLVSGLEGEAFWSVQDLEPGALGLYGSKDDGLSWQETQLPLSPGPKSGVLRLRHTPAEFTVPLQVQVGQGEQAVILPLDRFQPAGRVDFSLDFPEFAQAFNRYLEAAAPPVCPQVEHLANPDFSDWHEVDEQQEITHPDGWELTSGSVQPWEAGGAELSGTEDQEGALSQVVPVRSGCTYLLELRAFAFQGPALAEVIWRGEDCGEARTDRVPILSRESRVAGTGIYRLKADAPQGAVQAEVRFLVRPQNRLVITHTSFMATAEALANPDLRENRAGEPALPGWSLNPDEGPLTLEPQADTGRVRLSAGDRQGTLLQRFPVSAGEAFTFVVMAEAIEQDEADPLRIELGWLGSGGSPVGEAVVQELELPARTGSLAVDGSIPAEAVEAEIRIVVPAGSEVEIERLSYREIAYNEVPVVFLSEAPGELLVSDVQVAYEIVQPAPPRLDGRELCTATPPGQKPGRPDICYCPHCRAERELEHPEPVVTPAGQPARLGACPVCGSRLVHMGGREIEGRRLRRLPGAVVRPPTLEVRLPAPAAPTPAETAPVEAARKREAVALPPLLAVRGIGERRAAALAQAGIDTLDRFILASPERLAELLSGVNPETAAAYIEEARRLRRLALWRLNASRGSRNAEEE